MFESNRELRQELSRMTKEMKSLADAGLRSNDDKSAFGRLEAEAKQLKSRIEMIERGEEAYLETRRTGMPPNAPIDPSTMGDHQRADQEHRKAFDAYLRRGLSEISMADAALVKSRRERRDMSEGVLGGAYPGATSGFFTPVGFVDRIEQALKFYGPMLKDDFVEIMPTATGAPLPFPTSDDVSVLARVVGEGQQVVEADVNIGQIMFGAWKLSSGLVKVSLELLEDSRFNFETFLVQRFAERFGRGLNSYLTVGTGLLQPTGIQTAALAGGQIVTAVGSAANDGVGSAGTIGTDDLVNLEHSVDPLYRPGAKFMMHDQTLRQIKTLKDKYGHPIFQPAMGEKAPATINGYEYETNPYMTPIQTQASSPATTVTTVLFGQMKKFCVRRVKEMSILRLSERFADFGQVAFLAFGRYDSNLLDAGTHPVACLQNVY